MIDQADRLASAIREDIDRIAELRTAINSLPDTKVVNVIYRITTEGNAPDVASVQQVVETVTTAGGGSDAADEIIRISRALHAEAEAARDAAAAQTELRTATAGQIRDANRVAEAIYAMGLELEDIARAEADAGRQAGVYASQLREEEAAMAEIDDVIARMGESELAMAARTRAAGETLEWQKGVLKDMPGVVGEVKRASDGGGLAMLALATAAKQAGSSIGAMVIPTGAAAFGMGGAAVIFGLSAQALHLIVMGVFEFLAVFIPAMYAAGAAAAVLYQGLAEKVVPQIVAVKTATEAMGGIFGKTAGDVLGLGHSLQLAQNMANPGAYELLGEAILGANAAMGKLNSQGLSPFAQLGLDVTHMLDQFGAKVVVELSSNMGALNSLLANSMTDLREFGQIFGNLGHAILNFAAAMPGAAEIVLRLIDMFTQLIKWVSQLPPALIYVIMVIEELYRWSGVLAGIFSMIGRAIALVGTLGIPVFAKIGMNFGMMVANIITGVGSAIINFVAMGEKIGVLGAKTDAAATKMVGALGAAADFMSGPWGAAIALGVLGLTALAIWMMHTKNATDQLVSSINSAVTAATNLTVMNRISQGMAETSNALAGAQRNLSTATRSVSTEMLTGTARMALHTSAVNQARGAVEELTNEQQKLATQNFTVIQGADAIAKTYHVTYANALALADMAGVKLVNGFVGQSKAAQQAQLQIQALLLGYQKMDLTGGALNNTINALNVQAGIQASQVGKVNSAWDYFIGLSTSLTGAYSQLLLDFQQLGNIAPTVGGKIAAFSTTAQGTQLTVSQIAQALTKFSGSSAQIWQSFNQSVTQANTLLDNFRVASVAGVLSQKQYTEAVATVVAELLPYASKSKAALAEVSALAQEAGGPAVGGFQALKDWVDKNATSSDKFSGMIDSLTQKLSNVTQVARTFASTLQTDVLNAIAQAGISTSNITGLTQNYTNALSQYGAKAPQTQSAQDALTKALEHYGFKAVEVKQIEQELTGAFSQTEPPVHHLSNNFDDAKGKTEHLAAQIWNNLIPALSHVPKNVNTNITAHASGSGGVVATIAGLAIPAGQKNALLHFAGMARGGRIPGFGGGDSVPALLEPGETVVPKHLTNMVAPLMRSKGVPGFAAGGFVGPAGPEEFTAYNASNFVSQAMAAEMKSVVSFFKNQVSQAQAVANGISVPGHPSGSVMAWMAKAMSLTGVPQSWLPDLLTIAFYESGQNPNAINLSDSNAAAGDPSRGIMQVIMSTFLGNHQAGTSFNIYDPVANIAAAIRYIEARYGTVFNVPGILSLDRGGKYIGYDSGGYLMPGLTLAYNGTGKPEMVTPPGAGGNGGIEVHLHGDLAMDNLWDRLQVQTVRYNLRNSGRVNGGWSPL